MNSSLIPGKMSILIYSSERIRTSRCAEVWQDAGCKSQVARRTSQVAGRRPAGQKR
jgi:hypothetical protein